VVTESSEIINETFVQSQIDLFGIRYAEDAFYNQAEKEWQTVAYIDRNEAWTVYGRALSGRRMLLRRSMRRRNRKAVSSGKPCDSGQPTHICAAEILWKISRRKKCLGKFSSVPKKKSDPFGGIHDKIANLSQKIDDAKRNASVFIDCPDDFESLVTNAFSQALKKNGFHSVTENGNDADVRCAVAITEGRQDSEWGIFYYPSLRAVFTDALGAIFTFNADATGSAVTPDIAKRRAYTALAEKVVESFSIERRE
jgi:hypothetical protein